MGLRRRRKRCEPRADGAVIHRTTPISDEHRLLGHVCPCRYALLTASGGESFGARWQGTDVRVQRASGAHLRRIAAV